MWWMHLEGRVLHMSMTASYLARALEDAGIQRPEGLDSAGKQV